MLPAGGWACQPETRPFRLHAECLTIGSNTQSASLSCSSIVRERNALRRRPCDVRRSNLLPECPSLGPASDAPDFGYCEMRRPVLLNRRAGITTWPVFGRLRITGLQWGDRPRGEPVIGLATTAIDLPPGCLVSHLSLPGNDVLCGRVLRGPQKQLDMWSVLFRFTITGDDYGSRLRHTMPESGHPIVHPNRRRNRPPIFFEVSSDPGICFLFVDISLPVTGRGTE